MTVTYLYPGLSSQFWEILYIGSYEQCFIAGGTFLRLLRSENNASLKWVPE